MGKDDEVLEAISTATARAGIITIQNQKANDAVALAAKAAISNAVKDEQFMSIIIRTVTQVAGQAFQGKLLKTSVSGVVKESIIGALNDPSVMKAFRTALYKQPSNIVNDLLKR